MSDSTIRKPRNPFVVCGSIPLQTTKNSQGVCPVLYLLHGGEGDDTVWTEFGRANLIIDNLIAEKKAPPMVLVTPDGYAYGWDSGVAADKQQADFLKDLKEDLIPFVQANYRVSSNREQRALAGLSRGGAQTLNIGPNISTFSAAWECSVRRETRMPKPAISPLRMLRLLTPNSSCFGWASAQKTLRLRTQTGFPSF